MNPILQNIHEEHNQLKFTLQGINVSMANALRRVILSDMRRLVMPTSLNPDHDDHNIHDKCIVQKNVSRHNNEILKSRLGAIPPHTSAIINPFNHLENYELVVDVANKTDHEIHVTSGDFKIRNITTKEFLTDTQVHEVFPPNPLTNHYVLFARLRPSMDKNNMEYGGDVIQLTCPFGQGTARDDAMFNVVSTCVMTNTIDEGRAEEIWAKKEKEEYADLSSEEKMFRRENFMLLDKQRIYVADSYNFTIESIGYGLFRYWQPPTGENDFYENTEGDNKCIVIMGCKFLIKKLQKTRKFLEDNQIKINPSDCTILNCFDIVLENEDETLGKMLEYVLYKEYYETQQLCFVGFKKFHVHDESVVIRAALYPPASEHLQIEPVERIRAMVIRATELAEKTFEKILGMFDITSQDKKID